MKSFAERYNRTSFGVDTTNFQYAKLTELYKQGGESEIHRIDGAFISKSKIGESPVIIDVDRKLLVNWPSHTVETWRNILSDSEAVAAIKDGKVGYTIYEYESHGKKCYSPMFADL